MLQKESHGGLLQVAMPSLCLLPGRAAARATFELAAFQWLVGHATDPALLAMIANDNCNDTMPLQKSKILSHRHLVLAGAGVLAVGGAGAWWWLSRAQEPLVWQGYAEADFVKVGPTQQGLLTSVFVMRGDQVTTKARLFEQDDTADRAAREQASRQLKQAQEQLANLQSGGKETEIAQAEANLADARATRDRTQLDLTRMERLAPSGAATQQRLDQARADFRSAAARVQALEAALAQQRAPLGREREVMAQQAMVEAAHAAVEMAQWRLDQRRVVAPVAGVVADVMARPGETMQAGAPVISLLPPENIFVRFFVPEPMLAKVHRGEEVAIACDRCPAEFKAKISFISPQAEYTPPVIYSEASRAKLVYMVEARPPREGAILLNPGQPVAVQPLRNSGVK
jgi:HlyD family secretion protein